MVPALPDGQDQFLQGGGEMGERMRVFLWDQTPVGSTQTWPQSLRTAVGVCLVSAFPMIVLWGEDLVQFYNDPYRDLMGVKHPAGLGQPTRQCWPEVWDFNEPIYRSVQERAETHTFTDQRLVLQRHGAQEEAYFTLGYSPLRNDQGAVGGVLVTVAETTALVLAGRQIQAQQTELTSQNAALEAFSRLTRDLTLMADPQALFRGAQETVLDLLPPGFAVYWELQGQTWRISSQTGDLYNPELQAIMDAGLPYAVGQNNVIPWESRQPYYLDQYDPQEDLLVVRATQVSTTASLPVFVDGEVRGIFGVGLFEARRWTAADRAVLETVARSLGQALERGEQARELDEERAALDAFAVYTEQIGTQTDVLGLARQAIEVLGVRFPGTSVGYYQPVGAVWKLRAWNEPISEDLLTVATAGLSPDIGLLKEVLQTRSLVFTGAWDAQEQGVEHSEVYGAVVACPVIVQSEIVGVLSVGVPDLSQRRWTERERTIQVVRAVGQSLQLALERADLVHQLQGQREQLLTANEELTAFNYSVSHDLRTPVRHILGFASILRTSLGEQLSEKSARQMGVIESAAAQMNGMLDGLLALSRTSTSPLRFTRFGLGLLVNRARQDALPDLTLRQVNWQVGALPEIDGDQHALQKVMTHLIGNALKFTRTREQAMIEIWAEETQREWRVFVRDNGIGFDPNYQAKLFGVFQQLHSQKELAGPGVGLATVKRIIHRHGGQVWAEGTVDGGATFGFSLPKRA